MYQKVFCFCSWHCSCCFLLSAFFFFSLLYSFLSFFFAISVHHASFEFSYICSLYFCFLHGIKDVVTHHYLIIIYIPFKHNPADICMLKIHKPVTIHSLRIWAGSIIKELFTAIYIYLQCSCNNHKFFMPPLTTTMLPSGRKSNFSFISFHLILQ